MSGPTVEPITRWTYLAAHTAALAFISLLVLTTLVRLPPGPERRRHRAKAFRARGDISRAYAWPAAAGRPTASSNLDCRRPVRGRWNSLGLRAAFARAIVQHHAASAQARDQRAVRDRAASAVLQRRTHGAWSDAAFLLPFRRSDRGGALGVPATAHGERRKGTCAPNFPNTRLMRNARHA